MNRRLEALDYERTLQAWRELCQPVLPRELEAWVRDLCGAFRDLPYLDTLRCERHENEAEQVRLRGAVNLSAANAESVKADLLTIWEGDLASHLNAITTLKALPTELAFRFAVREKGDRYFAAHLGLTWKR